MRTVIYILHLVLLCTMILGCDGTDLNNDEEKLVGSWAVLGVRDHRGNITEEFETELDEAIFKFDSDKGISITLNYSAAAEAAGHADRVLTGSFSLESGQQSVFTIIFDGTGGTFESLYYRFSGGSFFNFSGPVDVLNPLFGGTPKVGIVEYSLGKR